MPKIKSKELPFADFLRAWRERMGISQSEAAVKLKKSLRTFQGWESGRPAAYEDMIRLATREIEGPQEPDPVKPRPKAKRVSAALDSWD